MDNPHATFRFYYRTVGKYKSSGTSYAILVRRNVPKKSSLKTFQEFIVTSATMTMTTYKLTGKY
jgi:hypothetical protein